jgi:hypothetical protein
VDEQILIDKIAAKLSGWKGRVLNKAGRLTLVSSVLFAIPTIISLYSRCLNGRSSELIEYEGISYGKEMIVQEVAIVR